MVCLSARCATSFPTICCFICSARCSILYKAGHAFFAAESCQLVRIGLSAIYCTFTCSHSFPALQLPGILLCHLLLCHFLLCHFLLCHSRNGSMCNFTVVGTVLQCSVCNFVPSLCNRLMSCLMPVAHAKTKTCSMYISDHLYQQSSSTNVTRFMSCSCHMNSPCRGQPKQDSPHSCFQPYQPCWRPQLWDSALACGSS